MNERAGAAIPQEGMLLSTGEMAAAAKIRRLEEMTLVAKAGKSKEVADDRDRRLPRAVYERELFRLQAELVMLQEWVRAEGARVVVVFEGRDAAGKGSAIKRVTEYLNPRVARIVALPAPTERQRTQWYFQRYMEHLPAAGEIVLFDRSWYNRAGVERVMGFCTAEEYRRFLHQCPIFERLLVEDEIILRKYWFSVSDTSRSAVSGPGCKTRCGAGNCPRWTWSRSPGGKTTRGPKTRCSCTPISLRHHGTSWRATTSGERAST